MEAAIIDSSAPRAVDHPRRKSLHALTGVRFFAAAFVVIFHTRIPVLLAERHLTLIANFFHNGFLAVPFFFILSGFILAYTYEGHITSRADRLQFWEARIARIWPTYALSLLFSSLPWLITPPLRIAIATAFMVQAWNPWNPDMASAWSFMAWTLSVEAFFYLIFPWLETWLQRLGWHVLAMILIADIVLGVSCNVSAHGLHSAYPGVFRFLPLPIIHMPEFIAGAALGTIFLRRGITGLPRGWTYAALMFAGAALMLPPGPWTSLVLPGFAALIYGLAAEQTLISRALSSKIALFGGGISYAMYLMQAPVREWVHPFVARHPHMPAQELIVPALLMVLAVLVFVYFEGPVRGALKAFFARSRDHFNSGRNPLINSLSRLRR